MGSKWGDLQTAASESLHGAALDIGDFAREEHKSAASLGDALRRLNATGATIQHELADAARQADCAGNNRLFELRAVHDWHDQARRAAHLDGQMPGEGFGLLGAADALEDDNIAMAIDRTKGAGAAP